MDNAASGLLTYNRKDTSPSALMHPGNGNSYRCPWIDDSITIHSDGNVSCGLDVSHGKRSFSNINAESIESIFVNPEYGRLRKKLGADHR